MAKVTVKHSDKLKQSDMTAGEKQAEKLKAMGWKNITAQTLDSIKAAPGYYGKFKSTWKGPFENEECAVASISEMLFEAKHS